jgi:DNA topoisomerase-2
MAKNQKINEELSKTYFQVDIKDHAKKKGMWSGSFATSVNEEFLFENDIFSKRNISYPQALYKGIDEILVNAIDQWIKTRTGPKKYKVTKIIIEFTPDGYISIFNNGNGIPIDLVKNIKGESMYVPQLISTEFLAGSNNSDDKDRISGGTNGLGIKLTSNNSKHFILETSDLERKKHYVQESHDRLDRTDKPKITPLKDISPVDNHKNGGTTFKFLPSYDIYNVDIAKDYTELNILFKTRAIQTAAHTGLNVMYNNEDIKVNNMETFAALFLQQDQCISVKMKGEYDWDVVVGLTNTGSYETLSIINGICVKTGTHLNYVRDLVIDGIKSRTESLLKKYAVYKKSMLQNNIFIMISGNIPNPAFDSQSKTNIAGSAAGYKQYTLSALFLSKFWKIMEPRLVEQYLTNFKDKKTTKRANTNGIKKYKKAKYAATNKSSNCTLLICEGDSAESMTRTALTSKNVPMDYNFYGTFNIGGVPMNSRTKSTVYESKDGKTLMRRQKQLIDNERLSSMEKVLNLVHGNTYETKDERDTLSYGKVVATVDQDLDGIGQIFGLILSHFERFWPALIKHGYVKQLATPIIRAFPRSGKDAVESFYTDEEYRLWVLGKFGENINSELTKWDIKYYKGLATHNDDEAVHMFQKYDESLYTITHDDNASKTFDIYYGNDPDLRKVELVIRRPPRVGTSMKLSCSEHLQSHTKEYQLDNIMRKLPNIYDGLNPARRKNLCAARKRFLSNNSEVKVFQLAGYVAEHMNYHHGSASLEKTIINMAQNYIGANNLPLLLPLSQFGSRVKGGQDAGAPRYIKTKLNKDLVSALFRSEDDYVIEYTYDEGVCNEPVHYIPVAPFALLESLEIPATGWKYAGYARDWKSVYKNVLKLISLYDVENVQESIRAVKVTAMPFWKNRWNGEIRTVDIKGVNKIFSMGTYTYDRDTNVVNVTELPFQEWNESYVEKMEAKTHIASVDDNSSKTQIDIIIKLKPDGFDKIVAQCETKGSPEFDIIEDYCLLKKKMNKHLNVIQNGIVRECESYMEILHEWFVGRHSTYVRRFDRLRVITRLRIMYVKQVIKFVDEHKKYNFSVLDEDTATQMLESDKFLRFNKGLLDNPAFTLLDVMEYNICDSNAKGTSYDYLFAVGPRQRMETARITRAKKLKELEEYYKMIMSPNIVNTTWVSELKELNDVITRGMTDEKGWLCGERKVKFK